MVFASGSIKSFFQKDIQDIVASVLTLFVPNPNKFVFGGVLNLPITSMFFIKKNLSSLPKCLPLFIKKNYYSSIEKNWQAQVNLKS